MKTLFSVSSFSVSGVLLLASAVACKSTAEGVKKDTAAAAEAVNDQGVAARGQLETEISEFKTKTRAKLDELTVAVSKLEAKAENGLDQSKSQLESQIDQTKSDLAALEASSKAELQQAKSALDARIADFGKRVNATFDKVGQDLDRAGDKVEKKLE